jgi:hypothetical protein
VKYNFAGGEPKRQASSADVSDAACRETNDLGQEVLTGTGCRNRQLTASMEGPVTADDVTNSRQVST